VTLFGDGVVLNPNDSLYKLYVDYKKTRDTLIQTLQDQPPRLAALAAIEHAQTILDRVLFIAFAESTALLPEKLIRKAWDQKSPFRPNGAWENFVGLFEAVDKGNPALDIPAYNGGLFARNAFIDALGLSNYVCENFAKIADYDFSSDVPVSVPGHIFEQSVSDIEKMRAEAQGQEPPKTTKRKRDGVVYTPGFVTRFIVEETIGKTLSERFAGVPNSPAEIARQQNGAQDRGTRIGGKCSARQQDHTQHTCPVGLPAQLQAGLRYHGQVRKLHGDVHREKQDHNPAHCATDPDGVLWCCLVCCGA
jgi:hypothetical protein